MRYVLILLLLLFFIFASTNVVAVEFNNNKFGIHLAQPHEEDLRRAAELVNSNGGKWGYVTLVLQENDRDKNKWQNIFDLMRELKLVPIIRLATQPDGAQWKRPSVEDADQWASFLNSLNWVVKDRYVILFNEPNHGAEWGGATDPEGYAKVAHAFARKLTNSHNDYIVMPAGFDASAPAASPKHEDEAVFIRALVKEVGAKQFSELFDAWSSHSYPNPGFVGPANGFGRGTVRTYQWELSFLKELDIAELPVFITETGWDGNKLSKDRVARNMQFAYENIWLPDARVKVVTPFILNYQGEPFANFSWLELGSHNYTPQFETVQSIAKVAGDPPIDEKISLAYSLPRDLVINSSYRFHINIHNKGQGIWDSKNDYRFVLEGLPEESYFFGHLTNIRPNMEASVDLHLKTQGIPASHSARLVFYRNDTKIIERPWNFDVTDLPSLALETSLFPRFTANGTDFEIQIFNEDEELVFKRKGVSLEKKKGEIPAINNIALGSRYRIVILKPYYLPRQTHVIFSKEKNEATFEAMLPLDMNKDGTFNWEDFTTFITQPLLLSRL